MIVSIHQPSYFPWLGLLHKIARSDKYIVMDEVQLNDAAYQHRNLFLSSDGKAKYLTIPFSKKGYLQRTFRELEIADASWRDRHLNFIGNSYRKHPYFKAIFPTVEQFFACEYERLIDAVVASMRISMELFGIQIETVFQSNVEYDRSLKKGDLVLGLLRGSGADVYLSGVGAQEYLDENAFTGGLSLRYDVFNHPAYLQKNALNFVSGLSCLDVLFNLGEDASRSLLNGGCGD